MRGPASVADGNNVLEVSNLTKTYDKFVGIFDLSFNIAEGEIVGLLGPNGSGKSTTLHCVTGILQETSGSILMAGIDHRQARAKNVFGFMPDDLPLPGSLRLRELQLLHRKLRHDFDSNLADFLVGLLGLTSHNDKYLGEYSHGMKRKLQLAIALAHRPKLLILDEPMKGLDPGAALILRSLLAEYTNQGGAVLIATHDLLAAERYCDRVIILADGRIIAQGSPGRLAAEIGVQSLEQFFVRATGVAGEISEAQGKVREMRYVRSKASERTVSELN